MIMKAIMTNYITPKTKLCTLNQKNQMILAIPSLILAQSFISAVSCKSHPLVSCLVIYWRLYRKDITIWNNPNDMIVKARCISAMPISPLNSGTRHPNM